MEGIKHVANILQGAANRLWQHRKVLFKALSVPVLVLAVLSVLYEGPYSLSKEIVYGVFELLAYTILAINTHRIILLGPGSVPRWGLVRPTKRELSFMLRIIGLGLMLVPIGLLVLLPEVGIWVMIIVASYLMARFSLVFPAIATDNPWTFGEAWDAAVGHQFLVIVVVGLLPAVIAGAEYLLSGLPYSEGLVVVVSVLTTVYTVSALSLVFESIYGVQKRS